MQSTTIYELAIEAGLLVPDPKFDNSRGDHRLKSKLIRFANLVLNHEAEELEGLKDQDENFTGPEKA